MEEALVSVVMPVFNAENYIADAIGSILSQTYPFFELIIVDDCGMDRSMEVVNQFKDKRIRVIQNDTNKGITYSRNRAIKECKGKYIAIMDDDDVAFPKRFEKQVAYLDAHTDIDVIGGGVEAIDGEGKIIREASETLKNPLYIKVNLLFHCIFHNSEMMLRKSLIEKHQIVYHENCYGMEDFRFWIECSKVGKMTNLSDVILQHRYHEETETSRVKRDEYLQRKEYYKTLQKMSFMLSGFELSTKDYDILLGSFPEGNVREMTLAEIQELLMVMRKLVGEARKKNMDFQVELSQFLKKQLQQCVGKCIDLF
jgi:glycosyltransferase involved in cell wall biosynthesis